MTVEELLKPRYKVIADYPSSGLNVGDVLTMQDFEGNIWYSKERFAIASVYSREIDKYPHLFKKLEWWEGREEKDMPEYVKHTFENKTWVYKIRNWNMKEARGYINDREVASLGTMKPEYDLKPATKSEYENQNQTL